jgi:predicted O-methyltransferase YrrM
MRDYPFSFNSLNDFSKSLPYKNIPSEYMPLYISLKAHENSLNFPAIRDDIGIFINFIFSWLKPKNIFEFGSGYGQSSFWYLLNQKSIKNIILTEKRDDLESIFKSLEWPSLWAPKLRYVQGDAFDTFKKCEIEQFDFILIDGVKADYLRFLELSKNRLSNDGLILIDNSYWRGSFLDDDVVSKKLTARKIKELHDFLAQSNDFESVFIPFEDGVSLIRKK